LDTKITKARIGTHFEYDWIKYIAVVLASVALWLVIYTSLNAVPHEDAIDVFCLGNVYSSMVDDDTEDVFRADVQKSMKAIKEVNLQSGNKFYEKKADGSYDRDSTLYSIVQTSFMTNDICIVPRAFFEAHMSVVDYQSYFLSFDEIEEAGYFASDEDKAAMAYIESQNAFLRYEFTEEDCTDYDDLGNAVPKTPEEIEAMKTAEGSTWGKRYGILLNNIPGLEKSCLMVYDNKLPTYDEFGEELPAVTEEYVLCFIKGYGLNVGTFNRKATLFIGCGKAETPFAYRADAFDFVTKMFTVVTNPASTIYGKAQIVKYAPAVA